MNFLLIGKGKWGSILLENLRKYGDIKKIIRSNDNFKNAKLKEIDWVFIASPNKYHYAQVKYFLKKKINVFCEKPLTLSYRQSLKLIEISKNLRVKLYIDDIEIYKKIKLKIKKKNYILRSKFSNYSFNNCLYALAYHDFYLLSKYIDVVKAKIEIISKKKLSYKFKITSKKKSFIFEYILNKKPTHIINGKNFNLKRNYIDIMINNVLFNKKIDLKKNYDRALNANYLIDKIKKI